MKQSPTITISNRKIMPHGNTYALVVPKAYIGLGLIDRDATYTIHLKKARGKHEAKKDKRH